MESMWNLNNDENSVFPDCCIGGRITDLRSYDRAISFVTGTRCTTAKMHRLLESSGACMEYPHEPPRMHTRPNGFTRLPRRAAPPAVFPQLVDAPRRRLVVPLKVIAILASRIEAHQSTRGGEVRHCDPSSSLFPASSR
jgi:hypothetical protein